MIFSFLLYCTIVFFVCQCFILFILMEKVGLEPTAFRLWGELSNQLKYFSLWWFSHRQMLLAIISESNLHNIIVKHYSLNNQYVVNCPNWNRTNITRVKFLCANLYTIGQCCGFHLSAWLLTTTTKGFFHVF